MSQAPLPLNNRWQAEGSRSPGHHDPAGHIPPAHRSPQKQNLLLTVSQTPALPPCSPPESVSLPMRLNWNLPSKLPAFPYPDN